jgi:solute carrier family 10 (sodium/bile acid cotransporter), member 7
MAPPWYRRHWFILGLAAAAGLGFAFPEIGARGGPLRTELTTRVSVALIFFLQGVTLSTAALRAGALRWRLHVAVQLFIFLLFPLTIMVLDGAIGARLPTELRTGFIFLAVLPTTVAACVVFTATAGGNVPGAIFNAAFANVAGVVITPLWLAVLLGARGEAPPMLPMITEIALLLLVPLAVGHAVRPLLLRWRDPDRARLGAVASTAILFIVFAAFSNSVQAGAFSRTGVGSTIAVVAGAAALFVLATAAAGAAGRWLGFDAPDRVALLFCAPHKTLAAGIPMGQIIFDAHPGIGLILLPLMIYHIVELIAGASIAHRVRLPRAADAQSAAGQPV